jgi:hypothetical protein
VIFGRFSNLKDDDGPCKVGEKVVCHGSAEVAIRRAVQRSCEAVRTIRMAGTYMHKVGNRRLCNGTGSVGSLAFLDSEDGFASRRFVLGVYANAKRLGRPRRIE